MVDASKRMKFPDAGGVFTSGDLAAAGPGTAARTARSKKR